MENRLEANPSSRMTPQIGISEILLEFHHDLSPCFSYTKLLLLEFYCCYGGILILFYF
jgi:hypothetical protein